MPLNALIAVLDEPTRVEGETQRTVGGRAELRARNTRRVRLSSAAITYAVIIALCLFLGSWSSGVRKRPLYVSACSSSQSSTGVPWWELQAQHHVFK